ncbi:MAG: methyltransferase domain-containing protein [Myxococcales bacterium]|nr:methyltransferase domain-containing protein [Myxococcales bacterium]MDD9968483.1 methyltransferase domain-containing protein [Myxococcales bacterium]
MGTELHYSCDVSSFPWPLREAFVELTQDAAAEAFVRQAASRPPGRLRTWAFRQLRTFMSDYDAYGNLGMYQMHLLSTEQWRTLLACPAGAAKLGQVLDVGAGRGDVTRSFLPLCETCHAIEPARSLRAELQNLRVCVKRWDLCQTTVPAEERYDLIMCLNVIDRVSHPKTLLRHAMQALRPGGRLVIAVPLPLAAHVDRGRVTVDQEEPLPEPAARWEQGVIALTEKLFGGLGLQTVRFTRAPYLCRGDAESSLYALDDALFVCRLRAPQEPG